MATLTKRVAEMIRLDFIASGQCSQGESLPTVRELARVYSTSLSTVSQALGLLRQEGVVATVQGSRTVVTVPDAQGPPPRHETVTLVIPGHLDTELSMRVFKGVGRGCTQRGWRLLLRCGDWTYGTERSLVREAVDGGCVAVVLLPVLRRLEEIRRDYLVREFGGFPVALVDLAFPEQGHMQVVFDNRRAGFEITRELLLRGHKRIGFMRDIRLQKALPLRSNDERYVGYLRAMREAGLDPDPEFIWDIGAFDLSKTMSERTRRVEQMLRGWRESPSRPTVIIALDDFWAHIICAEARAMGVRVPQDLDIAGFDNLAIGDSVRPGLLTTDPDFEGAGEIAVGLVAEQITGGLRPPVTYVLPVPVVCRRSQRSADPPGREDASPATVPGAANDAAESD